MRARSLALAVMLTACAPVSALATTAGEADSEVASRWAELLYRSTQTLKAFPPAASRLIGYFGVTLHEAAAPGRSGALSLAGQLNGLEHVPKPDPSLTYDWRIVVNEAAAAVLSDAFREHRPSLLTRVERPSDALKELRPTLARIDLLREELLEELAEGVPGPVVERSQAHGRAVASAIILWSQGDGHRRVADCAWKPPVGPGLWEPTPLDLRRALEPCWCELRTFVPPGARSCAPPPPTPYSTEPGSQFMREALEVKDAVESLTPEQRDIALFWADDRSVSGTPAGHWMLLVVQLSRERKLPLGQACEAHARVGIALADAFISCWQVKYDHSYVRPVTVIQKTMDRDWLPLLNTPPFPEYTSGHSVASGAAARVMTDFFGVTPFTDHVNDFRGLRPRSFASFEDAAREAAVSRLYGGIHFRPAIEHGLVQGDCVGRAVRERLRFTR